MQLELKAAAGLMSRFPARQPSANHNAVRLRDNQRRHRARVKAHTAELEARLAETKARLDAALDEIAHLTSEVESLRRCQVTEQHANASPDSSARETRAHSPLGEAAPPPGEGASQPSRPFGEPTMSNIAGPSVQERATSGEPDMSRALPAVRASSPAAAAHQLGLLGPPIQDESPRPQCSGNCDQDQIHVEGEAHVMQPDILVIMMSGRDCKGLPAPQTGESTTPCVDAYKVIEQQNFSRLDVAAMTRWLRPGFRKAAETGGGCRVDTQLLFALLDHISSSDGL
ncbi:hypothetical protein F4802DRAFT_92635 [Xylaria palmicola]|nr:hypothetical protein F4802DRAFT_92635 [Xylaria palmicola]